MPPPRSPPLSPSLTLYEPSLRVQQALGRQGAGGAGLGSRALRAFFPDLEGANSTFTL